MEIAIHSLHFEASSKLESFIRKKISRLSKFFDDVTAADVTLKVVKPESNQNKDASVKLSARGREFFAQEIADTFEEAIDKCAAKLERQVVKVKGKLLDKKAGVPEIEIPEIELAE
ncbi:MAG: ribosome-associated translation inhibitor RaiA [Dysgonamonadaceae bacterium]|jgi:putative sigma-54 modulation protein|nr:ribosome-associated translation inhibitor RaiA [Dysgonamonadaceae bacterium]